MWRTARATSVAGGGELAGAEVLARDAAEQTDDLNRRARVLDALADILERARREAESMSLRRRALELYERKGNVVSAAKLRTALGERPRSPQ